jgi:hypothetical protein
MSGSTVKWNWRIPRKPDFIIGPHDAPYLHRWWVIPRNRWFNIYLHQILASDDDRALHDHPWVNCSIILKGGYVEITPTGSKVRRRFLPVLRRAIAAHRLVIKAGKPCWSLFITGPIIRQWGFHCPKGWRIWTEFVNARDSGQIGRGCE